VIPKPDLASNYTIVIDKYTPTNPRLRRNHDALANIAVMAHVDHVVELRPATNPRTPKRRTVDTRVRTNLDIVFNHNRPNLRKLLITQIVSHVTKPIRTNTNTRMQYHTASNRHTVIQHNVRMNHTIIPNQNIRTKHHPRLQPRVRPDARILTNTHVWTNIRRKRNIRGFSDDGSRMYRRLSTNRRIKRGSNQRERQLRIPHLDQRSPGKLFSKPFFHNQTRRLTLRRQTNQFLILQIRDLIPIRVIEIGNAFDPRVSIANNTSVDDLSKLLHCHLHVLINPRVELRVNLTRCETFSSSTCSSSRKAS